MLMLVSNANVTTWLELVVKESAAAEGTQLDRLRRFYRRCWIPDGGSVTTSHLDLLQVNSSQVRRPIVDTAGETVDNKNIPEDY